MPSAAPRLAGRHEGDRTGAAPDQIDATRTATAAAGFARARELTQGLATFHY